MFILEQFQHVFAITLQEIDDTDFKYALHQIIPSTQRSSDILAQYKPVQWDDIGGLEDVKLQLRKAIEWPLKNPEAFNRLGIKRSKGVLLKGPPGCAKTKLVQAVATACHVTFLAISGAQLYSPFVGESERKIAEVSGFRLNDYIVRILIITLQHYSSQPLVTQSNVPCILQDPARN